MSLFLELLQVSLGVREKLSRTPTSQEWTTIYTESERQALLGIMLIGLDRIPVNQGPSKELLLQWIGVGESLKWHNSLITKRCFQLASIFKESNLSYCVLKGQGNAMMYPNPYARSAGDIDVWLKGGKKEIVEYVHSLFPGTNVQYHHMDFPVFQDVEVEVHYYPSYCYNKLNNLRLRKYFKQNSEAQFNHLVKWKGFDNVICVPTISFNLVFQLSHMMRHFFTQGIGLRHAIDYYYLLCQDIDEDEKLEAIRVIKRCGMYKFLCAIVWIEKEVLGLNKNTDIAPDNETTGKMVLREMMIGGNFGKKYNHNQGRVLSVYAKQMLYRMRFILEFPSEPLWRPFSLVWDFIKKRLCYCTRM